METLADLMERASAKLAEKRAAVAAKEAAALAAAEAQQMEFYALVERGVHDLLPEALWPYIIIDKPYAGQWSVEVHINVPECGPITCTYLPQYKNFNNEEAPFRVQAAHPYQVEYGELYSPGWDWHDECIDDIYIALALAAEQYRLMQEYEAAYETAQAELEAQAQAAPIPVEPRPTVAERLEGLIREIVNEVLAAGYAADYD